MPWIPCSKPNRCHSNALDLYIRKHCPQANEQLFNYQLKIWVKACSLVPSTASESLMENTNVYSCASSKVWNVLKTCYHCTLRTSSDWCFPMNAPESPVRRKWVRRFCDAHHGPCRPTPYSDSERYWKVSGNSGVLFEFNFADGSLYVITLRSHYNILQPNWNKQTSALQSCPELLLCYI